MRRTPPPRESFEELEIHTADGVALRARTEEPARPRLEAPPVCVLAHAMFARKSSMRVLGAMLIEEGYRVIAFDFRGHGDSKTGGSWGYDDFVRLDLPAVVDCARARSDGAPVVVVGHSLGGHVALAAQGTGHIDCDGIVGIAANVWHPALEPSRLRWAAKRMVMGGFARIAKARGRFPARALRIGSDDASARYVEDLARPARTGRWTSADGADDYLAALAKVKIPVCAVLSEGDRINCHPDAGEAFARRCGGDVHVLRVARSDDGGPPPDHMQLVTTNRAHRAIAEAVAWATKSSPRPM